MELRDASAGADAYKAIRTATLFNSAGYYCRNKLISQDSSTLGHSADFAVPASKIHRTRWQSERRNSTSEGFWYPEISSRLSGAGSTLASVKLLGVYR